jgi:hypothetical protein
VSCVCISASIHCRPWELADRPPEMLARLGPFNGVLQRARSDPYGDRARADTLAVVGIDKAGEAAAETRRRQQHHFWRNLQVFEQELALRHAAEPHGDFALARPQAFGFPAHGQEATNAQFLTALVENEEKQATEKALRAPVRGQRLALTE